MDKNEIRRLYNLTGENARSLARLFLEKGCSYNLVVAMQRNTAVQEFYGKLLHTSDQEEVEKMARSLLGSAQIEPNDDLYSCAIEQLLDGEDEGADEVRDYHRQSLHDYDQINYHYVARMIELIENWEMAKI